jgi:CRP-like cAMP-binding protein
MSIWLSYTKDRVAGNGVLQFGGSVGVRSLVLGARVSSCDRHLMEYAIHVVGSEPGAALVTMYEAQGAIINLRVQQRLTMMSGNRASIVLVKSGTLAFDARLQVGGRQILDFFMPGDVIPQDALTYSSSLSARALTPTSLLSLDRRNTEFSGDSVIGEFLLAQLESQLERANIHRLMIGRLGSEARLVSFLLMLARRMRRSPEGGWRIHVPMSRADIADHLALNPDTVSRLMSRLESKGLIARTGRHTIEIDDWAALALLTPAAEWIRGRSTYPQSRVA